MQTTFLRIKAVVELTGLARSTIYSLAKQGAFPAPIKLGQRASAWSSVEVAEWQASRIAASRPDSKAAA